MTRDPFGVGDDVRRQVEAFGRGDHELPWSTSTASIISSGAWGTHSRHLPF